MILAPLELHLSGEFTLLCRWQRPGMEINPPCTSPPHSNNRMLSRLNTGFGQDVDASRKKTVRIATCRTYSEAPISGFDSPPFLLGARMRSIIDFRQMLKIKMSINLCGADAGVSQHFLHCAQVATGLQQVGGK